MNHAKNFKHNFYRLHVTAVSDYEIRVSVAEPEPQGGTSFWWSRSRNGDAAPLRLCSDGSKRNVQRGKFSKMIQTE
jgi:hypothetical protein